MHLSKIRIRNFRSLTDAEIDIDKEMTLVVGRNNTAKTSCMLCLKKVLNDEKVDFDDYPLSKRQELYGITQKFLLSELTYVELCQNIPIVSVELSVDYSAEGMEDELGALSPFIIDLDSDTTEALVCVEYRLNEDEMRMRERFLPCLRTDGMYDVEKIKSIYAKNFSKIFSRSVHAVNPNNLQDRRVNNYSDLKALFPFYEIPAERSMGEADTQKNNDPFRKLLARFFEGDTAGANPELNDAVESLRDLADRVDKQILDKSREVFGKLIEASKGFGYPNTEELQLDVITRLDVDEQIKNRSKLAYVEDDTLEVLPGTHNGLGYKNLMKMELYMAVIAQDLTMKGKGCLPQLYIEEPEAHMHPQMQHVFADFLMKFLHSISETPIQVLVTSHSPHIANNVPFTKIRYAQKTSNGVQYLNLKNFADKYQENTDFIHKYLTLSRCDLFFCDKVILVEGASERILLPDIIAKVDKVAALRRQYYALIEIGGAFAHKFVPFMNFLGVPCLILTDIDSADETRKKVFVSKGKKTTNETLKWWMKKVGEAPQEADIPLTEIMKLPSAKKSYQKCHIEFQMEENGVTGRSLEEAIINVNRQHYIRSSTASEKDIEFKGKSKIDFALQLINDNVPYEVPKYIEEGLLWLSKQSAVN